MATVFQGDEILRMSEYMRDNPLILRDGQDSSIVSRIFSELDNFMNFVNITSGRYANLICKGDSFEARNYCVNERNFKFRKD
jgi:hypothetical protein